MIGRVIVGFIGIAGKSDNRGVGGVGVCQPADRGARIILGPSVPVACPLEEGAEPGRFRLHSSSSRFSPEKPYRPRVSPPSVEDRDACAIYASVRKNATPERAPVELALANLQKMLHRPGNVDGEGDGCGILVDIPRKLWSERVREGGHNPALALDDAFAVAHVFFDRSQDTEKALHDAREILGRGGFRILAERL